MAAVTPVSLADGSIPENSPWLTAGQQSRRLAWNVSAGSSVSSVKIAATSIAARRNDMVAPRYNTRACGRWLWLGAFLAVSASVLALHPFVAQGKVGKTYVFHATYRGTLYVRPQSGDLATTRGVGGATALGRSYLVAHDTSVYSTAFPRVAGQGEGSLTTKNGDAQITFLYIFATSPQGTRMSGYYVIEDGGGKFAGARGSGTFSESRVGKTGQSRPTTVSFKGTLTLD
jgi:hypothetical protein